jgi:hypothetical protein
MSLNAYLEAAGSMGLTYASATALAVNGYLNGVTGKRITVLSYGCTTPSAATTISFMVPVSGVNSIASALTAASTALQWTNTRPSNIYTGDWVAVLLDNGTFVYGTIYSTATTSQIIVSAGTMAAATIGNPVYYFATAANAGHMRRVCGTGQTQYTDSDANIGRFFGSVLGGPMIAQIPIFAAGTTLAAAGTWDYISYGYINV